MTRLADRAFAAVALGLLVAPCALPANAQSVPASFDCAKAASTVEKMICASATLRWQDLALSRVYKAARDAAAGPARDDLMLVQRDWVHERDRQCIADRTFGELSDLSREIGRQSYDCLNSTYLMRRLRLQDLAAAPLSSDPREIDLRPIAAARPEIADNGTVRISEIRASPNGSMLAVLLPSLELDGPDQVWLYRVADGRLVAATPASDLQQPHPDGAPMTIGVTAWQGDTLYMRVAEWGGEGETAPQSVYAATAEGSRRLDEVSADIIALLDAHGRSADAGQDELMESDGESPEVIRGNRDFIAWVDDRGHGTIELKMRKRTTGSPPYLMGWGGWELASYLFEAKRSLLVYPTDTGLAVLDMATRHERRIAGTSAGDRPHALSDDFSLLIWSTRNACGDELLAAQDESAPERFCLARLAEPEGSE